MVQKWVRPIKTASLSPVQQWTPLSPITVIMLDTQGNQMTGDIMTAEDPWRVCASVADADIIDQVLDGTLEEPFQNGEATFKNLYFTQKGHDIQIRLDLCYADSYNIDDFGPIFTNPIDVINVNECTTGNHRCDARANCTDTDGSYDCTCWTGYIGNGFICMGQVDECGNGEHTCDTNALCVDAPVGFNCICNS